MRQIEGKLYLLGAFSLAGTSVITGRILSAQVGSFTITALSLAIVLCCVFPFYATRTVRTMRTLAKSDWLMILLQATFGIFLFRMFLLFGLNLTSTVEAGILTGTTPAITSVLAYLFLKERPSAMTVLGIGGTVAGMVLLQDVSAFSTHMGAHHLLGNVLVTCAAASESTFNVISRKHKTRAMDESAVQLHPMVQTLLVSAIALILSIIPALCERPLAALSVLGWREWLALVWYGVIVTTLAFALFYEGARRCDAFTISAFSGMIPLTAMLLSMILLRERPSQAQWVGGALIILGMVLIGRGRARLKQPGRQDADKGMRRAAVS